MEISILELQHVLEVYLSSPLFLFYKESESPNEGSNFDMNKRREMGMVKKLRLIVKKWVKRLGEIESSNTGLMILHVQLFIGCRRYN